MFENLIIVAIIAAVLWLGGYAFYVYISRQQQDIAHDIQSLEDMLGESDSTMTEGE